MAAIRYEVDSANRLIITGTDRKSRVPRYRRVVNGRFSLDPSQRLVYTVTAPLDDKTLPRRIVLRGTWSLSKKDELQYTLTGSHERGGPKKLVLSGKLLEAKGNALLFSLTTHTNDGTQSTYVLTLQGTWQADRDNRLVFLIRRERGTSDSLRLQGTWEIGKNHDIIYRYESRIGKRVRSKRHVLRLRGKWEIDTRHTLTYRVDTSSTSAFVFRTGITRYFTDHITAEIGIGRRRRLRPSIRTVILYGSWKIARRGGLTFEVEGEDGTVYAMRFGAQMQLSGSDRVICNLRTTRGRDLGASLELRRKILEGAGEAFIRLLRSGDERAILAGATTRW